MIVSTVCSVTQPIYNSYVDVVIKPRAKKKSKSPRLEGLGRRIVVKNKIELWNNCATAFNTLKDEGMAEFHKFMSGFTQDEVKEILGLFKRIEREGYSKVRGEFTNA
jgi:hypothetical protein